MCTCVYIHSVSFVTVENLDEYKPKCGWLHSMGSSLELSEKEKAELQCPLPHPPPWMQCDHSPAPLFLSMMEHTLDLGAQISLSFLTLFLGTTGK